MDQDDFDNFEFIDYTTSGPWEKFIVQIEDCLKQWGLVHNSYGVFNPKVMPTSEHSLDLDQELALAINEDRGTSASNINSKTAAAKHPKGDITSPSRVYQHIATVTLEGVPYTLTYRYHPAKARIAAGVEQIDLDFLPTFLEGQDHHILHRWTALTHILVLSPASDAESVIIDLGSAKLLLSSFAIAFQNTGCNIPVFVPTGQSRSRTYTGLSIQPQLSHSRDSELGLEETAEDQAIEVRFNTVLVPYPPAQYTNLSGILDLFIERMGIDDDYADSTDGSEGHSQEVKERIYVSGLFSYHLENWYNEDWRQWSGATDSGLLQQSQIGQTSGQELLKLPFGPVHDPLKSLQLVARFASAPSTMYLDSKNLTDMDASQANIWQMKPLFKEDDYGILSGILEDVISSWQSEWPSRLSNSSGDAAAGKDSRSYTALLKKGARLIQGSIAMVDIIDAENIVNILCSTPSKNFPTAPASTPPLKAKQHYRYLSGLNVDKVASAVELGLRFRTSTTVPVGSFLWNMMQHLVDVISPNSHISYPTSFMGFLKVVWAELLVQFADHWRNREMIPWVQVLGEFIGNEESDSIYESTQDRGQFYQDADASKQTRIDLRFNILHQKLSMINCCIAREKIIREETSESISPIGSPSPDLTIASSPSLSKKIPEASSVAAVAPTVNLDSSKTLSSSDTETNETTDEEAENESEPVTRIENSPEHVKVVDESDIGLVEAAENLNLTQDSEQELSESPKEPIPSEPLDKSKAVKAFKGMTLLKTGEPLVIPRLQDTGYMTLDMIQQQEDLLEELGSSADAAKTRAEIQSAQLVSDMSAFKAANAGCILGDFIRWYSPKDWDEQKQEMSARMADTGNFWQELWEKSEPLSARQQKPLFDHCKEAEKALAYLKSLSSDQVFRSLIPTMFLIVYDSLASHPVSSVSPTVANILRDLAQELTSFPWSNLTIEENGFDLSTILAKIKEAETVMGRFIALVQKFPEQYSLAERMIDGFESVVEDGPERDCVYNLFSISGSFPKPACREFVLETFDPSSISTSSSFSASGPLFVSSGDLTGWHARPLQRRMYACFRDSEVRIVEAIAKDGMYM
ncbi:Rab3 GTPase-activating protein catalytic subunit [Entomortierella lignicola]|nr:Rab3 GTPase-activating protein catalytic subunit [Entomortierella lignicola]